MDRKEFYSALEKWIKETFLLTNYEQEYVLGYSEQLDVMDLTNAKEKVLDYTINFLRECKCRYLSSVKVA